MLKPFYIRAYALLAALSIGLFSAVDVLYLLWAGMSWTQIGVLSAVFNVAVLVTELPSSVVADVVSPRLALLTGLLARAAGLVAFAVGGGFWAFFFAEALAGVGMAMTSGSFDKILVNSLSGADKGAISDGYGAISRLASLGNGVGLALGVLVFWANPRMVWALAAVGVATCAVLVAVTRVSQAPAPHARRLSVGEVISGAVTGLRSGALWISVVAASSGVAPYLLWQKVVSTDGLLALVIVGVLMAGAAWCGARLQATQVGRSVRLEVVVAMNALLVIGFGLVDWVPAACVLFLVHVALQTLTAVRVYGLFQESVRDDVRATMTSVSSLADSGLTAAGSFLAGALMARFGAPWAMMVSVALYALLIVLLAVRGSRATGGDDE